MCLKFCNSSLVCVLNQFFLNQLVCVLNGNLVCVLSGILTGARFAGGRSTAVILCSTGLLVGLSGCLHPGKPLVAERSPVFDQQPVKGGIRQYTVRPGDTLYSIAWRFELPYLGLAKANSIDAPYTIVPGQTLRLLSQMRPSSRVRDAAPSKKTTTKNTKRPPAPHRVVSTWTWPMSGRPSREFGGDSPGLDYYLASNKRSTIQAAGGGEVVYAGNGIGGYERLVIIKHSVSLLSAYSFDGKTLVSEAQNVKAGTKLADIKSRGQTQQSLHFEIRKNGEPINPRSVLPKS